MKKKKTKSVIATIITIILTFVYQAYFAPKVSQNKKQSRKERQKQRQNLKRTLRVKDKKLVLTRHAKCRMKCRHIDIDEIHMVLKEGRINHRKSEPAKKPCPVVAREAYSREDKQEIRVISADCPGKQTIITVIDLSNEYNCYCE